MWGLCTGFRLVGAYRSHASLIPCAKLPAAAQTLIPWRLLHLDNSGSRRGSRARLTSPGGLPKRVAGRRRPPRPLNCWAEAGSCARESDNRAGLHRPCCSGDDTALGAGPSPASNLDRSDPAGALGNAGSAAAASASLRASSGVASTPRSGPPTARVSTVCAAVDDGDSAANAGPPWSTSDAPMAADATAAGEKKKGRRSPWIGQSIEQLRRKSTVPGARGMAGTSVRARAAPR